MKWLLVFLPLILASEIRNRRSDQLYDVPTTSMKLQEDTVGEITEQLTSGSLSGSGSNSSSSSGQSENSDHRDSESRPVGSKELTPKAVLNRVKWHGGVLTASQVIILPLMSYLLSSDPDIYQYVLGLIVFTLGLAIELYGLLDFTFVPGNQVEFWIAKVFVTLLASYVAGRAELESLGSLASFVNSLFIGLTMTTLLLPYIRIHDIKDL